MMCQHGDSDKGEEERQARSSTRFRGQCDFPLRPGTFGSPLCMFWEARHPQSRVLPSQGIHGLLAWTRLCKARIAGLGRSDHVHRGWKGTR